jgi:peptidoglycan/xylan/chitin deacetylase (PgdA/CDA1 family)/uncharacterized caspase-like protein
MLTAVLAIALAGVSVYALRTRSSAPPPAPAEVRAEAAPAELASLREVLAAYRKLIVLLESDDQLEAGQRDAVNRVGQAIFHENQARLAQLEARLGELVASPRPERHGQIAGLLDYIESDPGLYDADRLAFRELLHALHGQLAKDTALTAIKMHRRVSEDLDALAEIERTYDKEIRQVFGRFDTRAIELKREQWASYLKHLKSLYTREGILKDHGVVLPYPAKPEAQSSTVPATAGEAGEIFGRTLPKKTVVLTFDDGPHQRYTDEIAAILKQYKVPAIFFSVGRNLGNVDAQGKVKLNAGAKVARKLKADGYVLANHSYTHAQLSRQTGDALQAEVLNTDALLREIDSERSPLFRFPYGARNKEGMAVLDRAHLRSVMWNIDSLDWADPVPSSIADRVLRTVDKEGRGIILFHDIHARTVAALPKILERLIADGYQFAGWDGSAFKVADGQPAAEPKLASHPGYANSWAIVIGIDNYAKWPKLQHAVRDAQGVRQVLVDKFGFTAERVITLTNEQATRTGILSAFHDRLLHAGLARNDRLFVFFAGHGATRQLSSGRDLGYIIPQDSDPAQFATDAIPMTEVQNIAESLVAKHALFVMDACYSGLGLTRGGAAANFLRDNAKRVGRQMLTAGGADQLVADGGPGGHSVFTWTLLQGLNGKGDLNGDGLITATELAAFVAPAVSSVSRQTPAFGSLPGSEGGDFVFELPAETEFLNPQTTQLSNEAIALNTKLDAASPVKPATPSVPLPASANEVAAAAPAAPARATVTVRDLQGGEQKLVTPVAVPSSQRQLAQRANDRGLQLFKERQYEAAEAQFTEALKLRPDFALAANNLGFVYYKRGKFAEAARWFEQTIKLDPSRAVAYRNLGDALAQAGATDKAKKAYATYLELQPNGTAAAYARERINQL